MPKILITEACTVTGEIVARHVDVNDTIEVGVDEARTLTRLGRAFYVSREDDPTKGGFTVTPDVAAVAKKRAALIKADREASIKPAANMADLVAAAVAAELARRGVATTPGLV